MNIRRGFAFAFGWLSFLVAVFYGFASGPEYGPLIKTALAGHALAFTCFAYAMSPPSKRWMQIVAGIAIVLNLVLVPDLLARLSYAE